MEKEEQRRVVIVSCPFQGHMNPTLELATILHSNGFSNITIVHTKFNSPNSAFHPEFDFKPLSNVNIEDVLATGNILDLVMALNERCKIPLRECLLEMIKQQGEIGCVIYDDFMYFSGDVGNDLRLPTIIFRTISIAAFVSRLAILRLNSEGYFPIQDSMSEEPVTELPSIKFKDLLLHAIFKSEGRADNLYRLLANACDLKTSSAVIWNTIDCLEDSLLAKQKEKQSPIPIFTIGPMHKLAQSNSSSNNLLKEDRTCISWLDKQTKSSVLYISIGSVVSISEKELGEMAWVLRTRNQPFLWVIRPGSITWSDWIELLPKGFTEDVGERGCIVKWAPQKEVLAHPVIGGFWTHCGWNSTLESVSEGVPMICSPCFGDQTITARFVNGVWGIGLELENKLDRKEIEKCVRIVMDSEEGKQMRQKALALKDEVVMCLKEDGSSRNSLNKLVEFIASL